MSKLPDNVAIRVESIHKDFHLPHHNEDSIKSKIITSLQKKDKEVDTQHALRGISFDIKKGEFFGILGRNGSGKSTLLKIISEIYQPTKGLVQRQGSLVAFIELGVGFNPQLTGRENVYLNAALLGFSRKQINAFYDEVVEFAELEDHMEQKLKNYSSGMKVRLAFAVAIQAHADILVLDEVLAVGDADFQRKCYNYFKELKNEHKTIIFVSHSMSLVKEYCDRAILIEDGKIIREDTADLVADNYTRLFNKPKDDSSKQSDERWGSGEAKLRKVVAKISKDELVISLKLESTLDELKNLAVGINILDEKGRLVTGILAEAQKAHMFDLAAREKKELQYVFPNIFGGGEYVVIVSLKSANNSQVYDFWKNAATFRNTYEIDEYFPVVLPVEIKS